jgi:hypothetical protein
MGKQTTKNVSNEKDDIFEVVRNLISEEEYEDLETIIDDMEDDDIKKLKNTKTGETLLEILITGKAPIFLVEKVLEKGCVFEYKNKAGNTPFMIALNSKNVDAMRVLLEYGAKVSDIPLRWNKKRYQRAIELITKYKDVDFLDMDGNSLCPVNWGALTIPKLPELGREMSKYDEIAEFLNIVSGGDFLGEGSYGKVYRIDMGGRSYAIKKSELASPRIKCSTVNSYTAIDDTKVTFNPPAIMIHDEAICEYLVGKLVGEMYTSNKSICFVDTLVGGKILNNDREYEWRMMYPRLSGEINDIFSEKFEDEDQTTFDYDYNVDTCIVGIIHALGVVQTQHKIVHNDLACNNVMVEYIRSHKPCFKKDDVTYPIDDFDWFTYTVTDGTKTQVFEIDRSKVMYIPKIVDWGLACKYGNTTTPPLINKRVQEDDEGYFGNYYHEAIDLVMFIHCIFHYEDGEGMRTPFVREVAEWVYERVEGDTLEDKVQEEYDSNSHCSDESKRNNYYTFKSLFHDKTPREFFKQPFVKKFLKTQTKPKTQTEEEFNEKDINTINIGTLRF